MNSNNRYLNEITRKPKIVRSWNAASGMFVWVVANDPPRASWIGTLNTEDTRRWTLANLWCHNHNRPIF